ncbi:retrieval of early ER protein Rer1 [Cantharellus anzutake]|uniref:retrieval of early ER protein Rer1 n=1 Tax=Cantharellus anzutake TaxID=1750568 RepID=UPI001903D6AD|nr:retrieval of early ER protein Rer1 [Cantharellus anzutake]KAF8342843.1 retrieval of early ER protein Rer1 [Cantharellus anzutake]
MMDPSSTNESPMSEALQPLFSKIKRYQRIYQTYLDRSVPHVLHRWLSTVVLIALFILRIVLAQGWYIVCYAHAIYLLNLLLAFLQPKFDPSLQADLNADAVEEGADAADMNTMPRYADEEFRPFMRRLPEWDFWLSATRATVISLLCTTTELFDIPVYWPILLMYFLILFGLTMKRQISHMIKYRYIPFDIGKQKYNTK